MKPRFILLLILLMLAINTVKAQSPLYKHYTVGDGLPSTTVYGIIQDSKGYMWFGTENGAARFDGKFFQTFTIHDGLTDNIIIDLFEDRKGRIWFLTLNGRLCYYLNGKVYNPTNDPLLKKLPESGIVYSSLDDEEGNVYFAPSHKTIKISDSDYTNLYDSISDENPWIHKLSKSVYLLKSNRILFKPGIPFYFYTSGGLFSFEKKVRKLISSDKISLIIRPNFQKQIKEDFWICSYDQGIIKIKDFRKAHPQIKIYFPGKQVSRIYEDREENLWFGTTGSGVFLLPRNIKTAVSYKNTEGLPQENIKVLFKDKQNTIWAGSIKNNLYNIKNGELNKFSLITSIPGLNTPVYDICGDLSGNLYVATILDLIMFKKGIVDSRGIILKNAMKNYTGAWTSNYKSLSVKKNGNILAANHFMLSLFNLNDNLGKRYLMSNIIPTKNVRIYTATIDKNETIWIANNAGLNKLQGDRLISLSHQNPVLKHAISRIIETHDGNLILATRSKGIVLYDGSKVLQIFSEHDGLASDICNKLYLDKNKVWVATSKGVSQLSYKDKKLRLIRNYTMDDGLLSNEINDVVTHKDTIYVATTEGLSIILEGKKERSSPPFMYITTVQYGGISIINSKDSVFAYGNNYLKFGFIALTYQQPLKVQYMFRLNGADDTWKLNTSGSVDYPALLPGEYTFEVKAKKVNSNWSEIRQFHFIIKAPFWMQNWFYVMIWSLILTILAMTIYYIFRQKRNAKLKKREMQNHMVHLEQQALSALMNPHFIFNALNSIQEYLHKNDTLSANKYLSLFARLTRKNMEAVMKNCVSLEDELERLKLYLNFEKLRFGEKLKYEINVPEDMDIEDLLIPPMVLQPFVENAIWHGLMPLTDGGRIIISVKMPDELNYQVIIRDTGIGIDTSKEIKKGQELTHNSKGMKLTKERLDLWSRSIGGKFDLHIQQIQAADGIIGGTEVTITLPTQTVMSNQ
ncbi:MAG: two-component regulator propeller domain-containing protein [Bacteroidota bacterium]|nr:two-component regulator propeller domain-containing protein [Bacteroidota bacterium]